MSNAGTDEVIETQLKSETGGGQEAIEAERQDDPVKLHPTFCFQVPCPKR